MAAVSNTVVDYRWTTRKPNYQLYLTLRTARARPDALGCPQPRDTPTRKAPATVASDDMAPIESRDTATRLAAIIARLDGAPARGPLTRPMHQAGQTTLDLEEAPDGEQ